MDEVIELVSDGLDADVIHYNGPIDRPVDSMLIDSCIARRKRKNVLLLLVTPGGDADTAYRIARCLQNKYEKFILYVSGYCKSAGTLIATGAHELIMSDHGELGPLDVQMYKKDELVGMQSGLTVMDALDAIRENAFSHFENFLLETIKRSQGTITLKTAAEIATNLTNGLFAPISNQVDPLHIGEAGRAMSIAAQYGSRLLRDGRNIELDGLTFIISAYPSHGFVIDRGEADTLFKRVREPTENEILLAEMLGPRARWPENLSRDDEMPFRFLSKEPDEPNGGDDDGAKLGGSAGAGPGNSPKASRGKPKRRKGSAKSVTVPDEPVEASDSTRDT